MGPTVYPETLLNFSLALSGTHLQGFLTSPHNSSDTDTLPFHFLENMGPAQMTQNPLFSSQFISILYLPCPLPAEQDESLIE